MTGIAVATRARVRELLTPRDRALGTASSTRPLSKTRISAASSDRPSTPGPRWRRVSSLEKERSVTRARYSFHRALIGIAKKSLPKGTVRGPVYKTIPRRNFFGFDLAKARKPLKS